MDKKKYNCRFINAGIHFLPIHVTSCSANACGPILNPPGKIDWESLQSIRKQIMRQFNDGVIPECCENCYELGEADEIIEYDSKKQIDAMYISHWYHCNCSCTYCVHNCKTHGKSFFFPRKSSYYDLLPILQEMFDKKMVSRMASVFITGGEPSMLKELGGIIDLLLKHTDSTMTIFTSAVRYHKTIEKAISLGRASLLVSIDSGDRDLYRKIKRVDKFNQVVANLERYSRVVQDAENKIVLKYVLVENINDNVQDVEKWLQLALRIGIKKVFIEIDYNNVCLSERYYEIVEYFKIKCQELGFVAILSEYLIARLTEGKFFR